MGMDKRGHLTTPDTTVTVSIATMPTHSIKTETQPHGFTVGIPPSVYHPEPPERVVVFDRNLNPDQFSSNTQPQNSQRRTPDSTFSETFKEGVQEVQRAPVAVCVHVLSWMERSCSVLNCSCYVSQESVQ